MLGTRGAKMQLRFQYRHNKANGTTRSLMATVARPPVLAAALVSTAAVWWLMSASVSIVGAQSDPSVTGEWSAVQPWPIVSVHAALLPTGKVMFFPYTDDARLWDPSTGSIVAAARAGYNIFCSGLTLLPDGRLFAGGGNISNNVGSNQSSIYDPQADTWARQPDMNAGRWYPTTTTLADGSVLVASGHIDATVGLNRLPQVWTSGEWRDLTTAQIGMPLYPFMFLAPDGRVFNPGPQATSRYLNTSGTGTWTIGPASTGGRVYGSAVMYEPGKVLIVGGSDPPRASAEKIDLNLPVPTWQSAGDMHTPRRQLNTTILPDGTVLVTGGSSGAGFDNRTTPVYAAERWDPAQNSFTVLASATRYRGYHSIALLLPDGRVLSSGGDGQPNAEVFSPPYLFKGARPVVTSSPSSITYGESFFVDTPDATSIAAVTLVRLSAVTHAFNMNQRFLRLAFTQAPGRLTVTAPSVAEIAPPGHYMLFVLNADGVPSIAPVIALNSGAPTATPAPTNLSATAVSGSQINLAWTDNTSDESEFRIERLADGATYTEIGVVAADVTTYADTSLSAATQYWYRVRAYNATGPSAFAGPTSATTLSSSQPPSAPTGLVAARQSGRITLAWTDSSNNETGFSIERSVDGRAFSPIATVAQNVSTYVDTSPGSSKFVFYRVRAFNLAGNSAYSNVIKVRNN
jgi:hypothetical protein